jgi:hypothetical protein
LVREISIKKKQLSDENVLKWSHGNILEQLHRGGSRMIELHNLIPSLDSLSSISHRFYLTGSSGSSCSAALLRGIQHVSVNAGI